METKHIKYIEQFIVGGVPRPPWSLIIPIKLVILDAALGEYLPPLAFGMAKIKRKQLTSGTIHYTVSNRELDKLGTVDIRLLDDELTELSVQGPRKPKKRSPTEEERQLIRSKADRTDMYRAISTISDQIDQEREELYNRLRSMLMEVVYGFLQRWHQELVWLDGLKQVGDTNIEIEPSDALQESQIPRPDRLEQAIVSFKKLLDTSPDEGRIQSFLKKHPYLLAPEYVQVIPKVPLGSEYIPDFVIELQGRQYILVEIEAPDDTILTKNRQSAKALNEAQRQVEDWSEWIKQNIAYARTLLPEIIDPKYWIVIGRRSSLSDEGKKALDVKNRMNPNISVKTYDDIIDRAQQYLDNILKLFT